MKHMCTERKKSAFRTLISTAEEQAMLMVLESGEDTGELENEHPRCEQWMLVVSGRGQARAKQRGGRMKTIQVAPGSLLVIERQEPHQIKCTGREPLRTVNFYVPPAYDDQGEPLLLARRKPKY